MLPNNSGLHNVGVVGIAAVILVDGVVVGIFRVVGMICRDDVVKLGIFR